ncbi:hypothetical protein DQ04_03321000 [Trypanosoma grayi]|uniref:hypothetical protein n=1 Tax=Trypanosoma grayi TaxID=71804 RepID=UPI0004F46DA8|nr:hypothetical protein DQ04_03321000 [Trypanosoma grayi]KEG10760.1 hypothetical protein DQ04_03321000 [Trypanosoma grayi]
MDLRSPESGIRYLGAPSGAIAVPPQLTSAALPALCCAELIACDASQTYVAAVGSYGRRDVVQLWDLRMTFRPVCWHMHSRAGYTSLSWSTCETPTVIGTTRNGGLRVHAFTDMRPGDEDDEEEERALSGTEDDKTSVRSAGTGVLFSLTNRFSRSAEERCRMHARVPAASVAWLTNHHATLATVLNADAAAIAEGGGNQREPSRHVELGSRTDLPCVLLLNAKTGELYPQVFSPEGGTMTMVGETPLWSAGPNLFLPLHERQPAAQQAKWRCAELEGTTSTNNNSMDSTSTHDLFDGSSEAEKGGGPFSGSPTTVADNRGAVAGSTIKAAAAAAVALKETMGITGVDRTSWRLERLRAGFLPHPYKLLSVLAREGRDREAFALFRYGWYAQRYLHPGKAALPTADVIPGILSLLQHERQTTAPSPTTATAAYSPQQTTARVRELILCAMGWWDNQGEEEALLETATSPTTTATMVASAAAPPPLGGDARTHTKSSRGSVSPSCPSGFISQSKSQHQQQPREKSSAVSPPQWSRASLDESLDVVFPMTLMPMEEYATGSVPALGLFDRVEAASLQEAVERRAAILVCMERFTEAALLLSHHSHLHPLYTSIALQLSAAAVAHDNSCFPVFALEISGCSYWISLCLSFVEKVMGAVSSPTHVDKSELHDAKNNAGGSSNSGRLCRLPLQMRRECFTFFTKRFPRLPLSDRIALATSLLLQQQQQQTPAEDHEEQKIALLEVLREMTQQQFTPEVARGSSLLLAAAVEGLDRNCTLLQRYVDETGDVQTPLVYVALYGPSKSKTWRCWNDAYRSQLNAEGYAILRSHHDLSCIKIAQLRAGEGGAANTGALPLPLGGLDGFAPPAVSFIGGPFGGLAGGAAQDAKGKQRRVCKDSVELRCKCGQPVSTTPPPPPPSSSSALMGDIAMAGRRQQASCSNPNCLTPMCTVCGQKVFDRSGGFALERCFTWCTVCLHGGHWAHLRDWFAKHQTCPAEDCPCPCSHPSLLQDV